MTRPAEVPGYLGRVLRHDDSGAGTCFQVAPGVLVTAWHVLDDLGAGGVGDEVLVDPLGVDPTAGGPVRARVHAVDPTHDLAVLLRDQPLPATAGGLVESDSVRPNEPIAVTGVAHVPNTAGYRYTSTTGAWSGPAMRDNQVPLGQFSAGDLVRGMSGGPVRRVSDDRVVGVVSGRYNSADNWMRNAVWVARTEDLVVLLAGVAEVALTGGVGRGAAFDVTLAVSETEVRLSGAGVDVTAAHAGVRSGLVNALHDVRRERSRHGHVEVRDEATATALRTDSVSLRQAGRLLAESFLPDPVAAALGELLRRAERADTPVRLAVHVPGLTMLPWEAMPDPVGQQPLALHRLVTVYRHGRTASPPAALPGPLRIVVAIASPESGGGAVLDYERELAAVLDAVRGARQGEAQVEVVPFATTGAIRAALDREEGVHVLHISAHGGPGVLHLEEENGDARAVSADELLAEAIPAGKLPPVISLAACYTDVAGEEQGSSYAARLVESGAGAVIATQTSVTDAYATRLFARVYAELARSASADVVRAVADARRTVQRELTRSGQPLDRVLAALDEWSVVTVLAGAPAVPVLDPSRTVDVRPRPTVDLGGLLARPVGQFVGRRHAQRVLPSLLDTEIGGVLLHGIGGIGKTTLAAEVLRRATAQTPAWRVLTLTGPLTVDGILGDVSAAVRRDLLRRQILDGPQFVAAQVCARMDVPWQDRLHLLRQDVLAELPLLLVLDNFEDNLAADGAGVWRLSDTGVAGLLAAWLNNPGRSRLVITSRYPFALPEHAGDRLRGYQVPPMSLAETRKLLWSLPHLDRYAVDRDAQDKIWRSVGGHPRSLEYLDALLGAGQGRFPDITRRLRAAVEQCLGAARVDTWLAEERTLDAAIAQVATLAADDVLLTDHLTTLAQVRGAIRLLAGISVYREPVDLNAALFQVGTPDESAGSAADGPPRPPLAAPPHLPALLQRLRDASLIGASADGRLVMHRWTATELHDHWTTAGSPHHEPDLVMQAHHAAAAYWLWRVDVWPQNRFADVQDLLEARHHLIAAGDLDTAGTRTEHICDQLHQWGAWDREASLIHDTLRWLPATSPRRPAWYHQLGILAQARGDYPEAERRYQQSLTIFEELGNRAGAATGYHQLGMLAQARGDYPEAERRYQQSLTIKEELGNRAGAANSYHQLGMLAHDRGDYPEAERRYQQSLTIKEELGNRAGAANSYGQLGMLAHDRGDYPEAERRYQQSLTIFEELGNRAGAANSYHQLGMLAHDRGDYPEAERRYQQSLTIEEELGNRAGAANSYHQLGMLAHDRGDYPEAERRYQQSLTIKEELGNRAGAANSYHQLGMLAHDRGDYPEAERRYQQSLTIEEELGNRAGTATSLSQLGNLRSQSGRPVDAVPLHCQALALRLALDVPQARYDLTALHKLRTELGPRTFTQAAGTVLDNESLATLASMLDELELSE
ncbi:tetratricopeptide repeat protein [Solwaraspora sp. WMMD1047]|uniref:tetratricopeptide repeat protein n=1 Tax=Solwaraspora sp. WMMD1047 TaxID=3016102 RepID=UPI002417D4CE|nr:tetratricopeptide repeat protein [Solwaraspora sp. WMMD1047]MDG4831811.1 tetratricopeptide repeat protein [Solwaraspora sp. WMMD1047]